MLLVIVMGCKGNCKVKVVEKEVEVYKHKLYIYSTECGKDKDLYTPSYKDKVLVVGGFFNGLVGTVISKYIDGSSLYEIKPVAGSKFSADYTYKVKQKYIKPIRSYNDKD